MNDSIVIRDEKEELGILYYKMPILPAIRYDIQASGYKCSAIFIIAKVETTQICIN